MNLETLRLLAATALNEPGFRVAVASYFQEWADVIKGKPDEHRKGATTAILIALGGLVVACGEGKRKVEKAVVTKVIKALTPTATATSGEIYSSATATSTKETPKPQETTKPPDTPKPIEPTPVPTLDLVEACRALTFEQLNSQVAGVVRLSMPMTTADAEVARGFLVTDDDPKGEGAYSDMLTVKNRIVKDAGLDVPTAVISRKGGGYVVEPKDPKTGELTWTIKKASGNLSARLDGGEDDGELDKGGLPMPNNYDHQLYQAVVHIQTVSYKDPKGVETIYGCPLVVLAENRPGGTIMAKFDPDSPNAWQYDPEYNLPPTATQRKPTETAVPQLTLPDQFPETSAVVVQTLYKAGHKIKVTGEITTGFRIAETVGAEELDIGRVEVKPEGGRWSMTTAQNEPFKPPLESVQIKDGQAVVVDGKGEYVDQGGVLLTLKNGKWVADKILYLGAGTVPRWQDVPGQESIFKPNVEGWLSPTAVENDTMPNVRTFLGVLVDAHHTGFYDRYGYLHTYEIGAIDSRIGWCVLIENGKTCTIKSEGQAWELLADWDEKKKKRVIQYEVITNRGSTEEQKLMLDLVQVVKGGGEFPDAEKGKVQVNQIEEVYPE